MDNQNLTTPAPQAQLPVRNLGQRTNEGVAAPQVTMEIAMPDGMVKHVSIYNHQMPLGNGAVLHAHCAITYMERRPPINRSTQTPNQIQAPALPSRPNDVAPRMNQPPPPPPSPSPSPSQSPTRQQGRGEKRKKNDDGPTMERHAANVHNDHAATFQCPDDPSCTARFTHKTPLTKHRQQAHGFVVKRDQSKAGKANMRE